MSIEKAIEEIQKQFGKESIFKMGEVPKKIDSIPSGSIPLDEALGVGGYPKGRVIEIFGPESSGKTTLALHAIAESQKLGGKAAFIDAEHALDIKYAKNIGVDIKELLISQPSCGEEALDIADFLIRSNEVDIIVIDSVAALTPRAEIEGSMGASHMGLHARLMSQALRKIAGIVAKTNTVVIFINQIRYKIGVMYGSPETTTGGNALKFYASIRLDIRKRKGIEDEENIVGNDIDIKVVKNKVAPPFKIAHTVIMYGVGIYKTGELLRYNINNKKIEKSGTWYKYKDQKMQGEKKMLKYIEDNIKEFEIETE